MIHFYEKLLKNYKIKKYKKNWNLYKIGSTRDFNLHLIYITLLAILYFLLPQYEKYTFIILAYFICTLLIKFGEYQGYNECLHEIENDEDVI